MQQLRSLLESADVDDADRMPTFFEAATLLAWMLFDEQQVQLAVLETGLGDASTAPMSATPSSQ